MYDEEYLKSLFRCPLCGTLIGCKNTSGHVECSVEEFQEHIKLCREENRVKLVEALNAPDRNGNRVEFGKTHNE
jgi:hypothetical protein